MTNPIPTEPLPDDSETIMAALAHGMTGNPQTGLNMLKPMILRGLTPTAALCAALAESIAMNARRQAPTADGFGLIALRAGLPADANEVPAGPRFAAQFSTAWMNGQRDTAYALFDAIANVRTERDADALLIGVRSLYEMAVESMRQFTGRD